MRSYSEREVFTGVERCLLHRAQTLVELAHHDMGRDGELRCHELARAVGTVLELEHCDGWYGMISHTWLWATKPERLGGKPSFGNPDFYFPPNILDVYTVGRSPQVQLVSSSSSLPWEYRRGDPRTDVHQDVVQELLVRFGWSK